MDLFSVILFLCLYYVRPDEWISVIKFLQLAKVAIFLALFSLFYKHRGLGWKDIVKTPHDWMMLTYFLWMVCTSPFPFVTFKLVSSFFVFYVVTVVTLNSVPRMQRFCIWWAVLIWVLSLLAVASQFGFDPTDSYYLTQFVMKGRLAFGKSIFNNANSLGHSIVPLIMMLYFIGIWKRPVFVKITTMVLLAIPVYCVWLTVSKGAFLSGFATILLALMFRRSLGVQIFIICAALTFGWAAVQQLPRMQELSSVQNDQGIQGRVAAFKFGLESLKTHATGLGWARFEYSFIRKFHYHKGPHSSYNRIGAELGRPGLFLFLGIIYCCFRTLLFAHTVTDEEERIRRILFVLVISYTISSWMVGWADRATFFLMAAATAAFHRHLLLQQESQPDSVAETAESIVSISDATIPQPALITGGHALVKTQFAPVSPVAITAAKTKDKLHLAKSVESFLLHLSGIRWNRIGWIDLVLIAILTEATVLFWGYIITRM